MASPWLFEMLPDEILLAICRYLTGSDVLYSFYNLNTRLNVTLTGYCRYLDLSGVTYPRFDFVVCHILPRIASSVRSFVFHGAREKLLSARALNFFYDSPMSFTFPQLRRITLESFSGEQLSSFIDLIQDFSHLVELNIRSLKEPIEETLLTKVFAANNGRLNSVTFDEGSVFLEVPAIHETIAYLNIQELTIKIKQGEMLPHLFALVPHAHRLNVNIEESWDGWNFGEAFVTQPPLIHLTNFHLCTVNPCNLDELDTVLRQMPSLQILTLDLSTRDERLIQHEHFVKILPPSLKQIHFLIHYYFHEPVFEVKSLVASWAAFLPISCLLDETNECVLMFTTSVTPRYLALPATIGKQIHSGCEYTQRVQNLFVYSSTSLVDMFVTVQHFHHLQKLCINMKNMSETCASTPLKQPAMLNLPHLKELDVLGICALFDILKAAPNLDYLTIDFDCLKILLDDEPTCDLLQQRITRLDVHYWTDIESNLLQRVSHVFCHLRYLYIDLESSILLIQSILSIILAHSNIKELNALYIKSRASEEINPNLQQSVIDHTNLTMDDLFAVTRLNNHFILWK